MFGVSGWFGNENKRDEDIIVGISDSRAGFRSDYSLLVRLRTEN